MQTSIVIYLGEQRTEMKHLRSGSTVITDAPIDNKGKGEAFSPTDLLATSLASCMLTIIGQSAIVHGFNIDGTIANVTKTMYSDPRRIGEIKAELIFPKNNYSDKQKKLIERAAMTCPVSKSLHPEIKQDIIFTF
jgi:putative redox protein